MAADGGTGTDGTAVPPEADRPTTRPKGHKLRNALIGCNILLVVCVLGAGATYAYARYTLGKVKHIEIPTSSDGSATLADAPKGEAFTVLLVGSDSRSANQTKADIFEFGPGADAAGQRSDTMMLVRVDPKNDRATVLSIPRDLDVDIEGAGRGRINGAFANLKDANKEDPARLIRTITANLGIPINHYMEVNFDAFRRVVDAIGGVSVYFENPARDKFSHLDVKTAGCVKLDGVNALRYVRSRHYQYQENGRWKDDPNGDLSRIRRQQEFMRRVISKVKSSGMTNPIALTKVVNAGVENLTLDEGFSQSDVLKLALQMRDTDPAKITYLSVPTEPFTRGGADLLRLAQPEADQVFVAFGSKPISAATSSTVSKATAGSVRVSVLNGTTTSGLASRVANDLTAKGFKASAGGNAKAATQFSAVSYGKGAESGAKALAAALGIVAAPVSDRSVASGTVQLTVGSDFASLGATATTTTAATTAPTVAPPTTTPLAGQDFSVAC